MTAEDSKTRHRARLAALRQELARHDLSGFLVPRADAHQGEFVAPNAERLAWLTGFTGSAGLAVVLTEKAAIFTDGRYTLQLREQADSDSYTFHHIVDDPPDGWLSNALRAGSRLGFDPWLHTVDGAAKLEAACKKAGAELVPCAGNPLDTVWTEQPAPPRAPIFPHPLEYAGRSSADKRRDLAAELEENEIDVAVLTAPDSIAWLLNIRGGDVAHTPLALGFALLHKDGAVDLFMDRRKVGPDMLEHLGNQVRLAEPGAFGPALDELGRSGKTVRLNPAAATAYAERRLSKAGAVLSKGPDPCALPKACKNDAELAGARAAHSRDGAALTRFLAWLDREAVKGGVTEISARDRLAAIRQEHAMFRDLSFDTIAGAGPNGAIVHYRVDEASNRSLESGTLFLLDSGAQYPDGTTDVTRTVAIGTPSPEMRDRFTRVLKGHIALATARFPKGTTGPQLDVLARAPLWEAGLDYDHGTGHGVGSYLGVHEGPQRISKQPNKVALKPGMICSNEPGYYKTGAYGIRIENLVAVCIAEQSNGAEHDIYAFETLTLAPIDRNLVDTVIMTRLEVAWLDAYHARVWETIGPLVDPKTAAWLERATMPLIPA